MRNGTQQRCLGTARECAQFRVVNRYLLRCTGALGASEFNRHFTNGHNRKAHPPRSTEDIHAAVDHIDDDSLSSTAHYRAEESTLHAFPVVAVVVSLPHG